MNPEGETSLHLWDYLRVLKAHKFVIITVFFLVTLSGGIWTFFAPKKYVSQANINIETDRPTVSVYGRDSGNVDPQTLATQFEVIKSEKVLNPVIEKLSLQHLWAKRRNLSEDIALDVTRLILKQSLDISPQRGTTIIGIRCWSEDKQEAATIANEVAHSYEKYRLDEKYKEANKGLEKIQEEYTRKVSEVDAAREKVERLRKEYDITDIGGLNQGNTLREEQEDLRKKETELSTSEIELRKQRTRYESLKTLSLPDLKNTVNALQSERPIAGLAELILRTDDAEKTLKELKSSSILGPKHPDVMKAQTAYDELRSKLEGQLNGVLMSLKITVNEQEQKVQVLKEEITNLRKRETESHSAKYEPFFTAREDLERQLAMMKDLYDKQQKQRIEQGQPVTPIRVIDSASAAPFPSRPNIPLNIALSIIVGLILGVSLAFFIEYLDTSIHKVEDVEKFLNIPVLGVVPRDVRPLNQMKDAAPFAEFYRVLRANIEFARKETTGNAITFCSGGAGEGKSTTLLNTAIIYAQHGHTVLVVDSDIRRPSLHRALGLENRVGLTDLILKGVPLESVVYQTSVPNLHFIPSGTHHNEALGMLAMERMRELIADLKRRYNMVFFDSPPVLGISDASILAREVDVAVLVIQFRRFPRQFISRAQTTLQKAGVRLIGAVLNQVKTQEDDYYSYNYEYYHGKKEKKKEKHSQAQAA
jgi:polysaccharide biosynthesis transport protein